MVGPEAGGIIETNVVRTVTELSLAGIIDHSVQSPTAPHLKVPVREGGLKARSESGQPPAQRGSAVEGPRSTSWRVRSGVPGPHGAGKTTILKMLSGLLYSDSGVAEVLGHQPQRREPAFLRRVASFRQPESIAGTFGPRHVSSAQALYGIPTADCVKRRDQYIELLDLGDIVLPSRSGTSHLASEESRYGQARCCTPRGPLSDEPTSVLTSRCSPASNFVRTTTRVRGDGALTSHYMADVVELCERVVVIHPRAIHYTADCGLRRVSLLPRR